jgi:hypothetical protein
MALIEEQLQKLIMFETKICALEENAQLAEKKTHC